MSQIELERVFRATLPPALIINKFVRGIDFGYEQYLTEFINQSKMFLSLSGDSLYKHISEKEQNSGECDCISNNYELDFKLFGTQSSIYAASTLSRRLDNRKGGVILYQHPILKADMTVSITDSVLKEYSLSKLEAIAGQVFPKFNRVSFSEEQEVGMILETMRCKKNCLFFHKDYIFTNGEYRLEDIILAVENHLNQCLTNVFSYREKAVPDKDSFFAMIIQSHLCIAKCKNGTISFLESIPLSNSNSFCCLHKYIGQTHKAHIKLR